MEFWEDKEDKLNKEKKTFMFDSVWQSEKKRPAGHALYAYWSEGDPTMLSEAKRWPPFFFLFFYSGPAGRWPSVRPTSFSIPPPCPVAFVQFHLSTLAGCPDIQLDLYFLEHTSDFIISDCKHGTDVIESMLKRTIDLFVQASIFLWPPWRRTLKKKEHLLFPGRHLLFPWVVFLCRYIIVQLSLSERGGLKTLPSLFDWLHFNSASSSSSYITHTQFAKLISFSSGVVYCRAPLSLSLSRISFKLGFLFERRERSLLLFGYDFVDCENEAHSRRQS